MNPNMSSILDQITFLSKKKWKSQETPIFLLMTKFLKLNISAMIDDSPKVG